MVVNSGLTVYIVKESTGCLRKVRLFAVVKDMPKLGIEGILTIFPCLFAFFR